MLRKLTVVWHRIELKQKLILVGLFFGMVFSWGVAAWFIKYKPYYPEQHQPPSAYTADFLGLLLVIMVIVFISMEYYSRLRDEPVPWYYKSSLVGLRTCFLSIFIGALPSVSSMAIVCGLLWCIYTLEIGQEALLSHFYNKQRDKQPAADRRQEA